MIYAPVIIPTMNRYHHLKRCIDSLERNTYAKQTEIYLSLDYPPDERYTDGYQRVAEYLKYKKQINGFKSLEVFYQKENLGSYKNTEFLKDQIRQKHNVYIFTEDDNEFSVNFLEYIDKGLWLFRNDERIAAISGYNICEYECGKSNIAIIKIFPAYGTGMWFNKEEKIKEAIKKLLCPEKIGTAFFSKLRKEDRTLFNHYILSILLGDKKPFWGDDELRLIDSVISIYLHYSEQFTIIPKSGKSRTFGNDGSGENMRYNRKLNRKNDCLLDNNTSFDYVIEGEIIEVNDSVEKKRLRYNSINSKQENRFMRAERFWIQNLKADLAWVLLKNDKYNRIKTKERIDRMRNLLGK